MRDVLAGAFLGAFSLLFIVPGIGYGIGTLGRPGAGGVPVAVGLVMLAFGAVIAVGGLLHLRAEDQAVSFDPGRLRHISFVIAALAVFALLIERTGLMPSTAAAVIVASLADRESRVLPTLVLAVAMCGVIWLIFKLGLQVKTPLFESPF